jgi:hypothetical protein
MQLFVYMRMLLILRMKHRYSRSFAVFDGMSIQLERPALGFWPLLWSRAPQAALAGGKDPYGYPGRK